MKNLIYTVFSVVILGLYSCGNENSIYTPNEPLNNQTSHDDQTVSKITLTTSKDVGSLIALEIYANVADRKNVWIDLNNNGIKDEGEAVTQFQQRDPKRPALYAIKSKTITIYGDVTYLNCAQNDIQELDVTNNKRLVELNCSYNQLESIDLSQSTELEFLDITKNKLKELDLSNNPKLINLWCLVNQLESLNLSNNKALKYLNCSDNQLTSLDVSSNNDLIMLHYNLNPMVVDISKNSKLENLGCSKTKVSDNFDLSPLPNLSWLFCCSNELNSIDVSKNPNLTLLDCSNNNIQEIDVSHNLKLESFHCHDNMLKALDVSKNKALLYVECQDNHMGVEAVNAFFESLCEVSKSEASQTFHKSIQMQGNPGNWEANTSIALNKGWRVYF